MFKQVIKSKWFNITNSYQFRCLDKIGDLFRQELFSDREILTHIRNPAERRPE